MPLLGGEPIRLETLVLEDLVGRENGAYGLGQYPAVCLAEALKAQQAARLPKGEGINLIQDRKVEKLKSLSPAGYSFRVVAREWFDK